MNDLVRTYGVSHECFASPINATLASFCSAFADTDAPFGSVGSFFDCDFTSGGCYQVAPPYNDVVLQRMAVKLEHSLDVAEAAGAFFADNTWTPYVRSFIDQQARALWACRH